jgi:hypothetical protein
VSAIGRGGLSGGGARWWVEEARPRGIASSTWTTWTPKSKGQSQRWRARVKVPALQVHGPNPSPNTHTLEHSKSTSFTFPALSSKTFSGVKFRKITCGEKGG